MSLNKSGYDGAIPAPVRYAPISPSAKVAYAEIAALTLAEGYCWATNEYFCNRFNVSQQTVSGWIKELKDQDFIKVESSQEWGMERRIWLNRELIEESPFYKKPVGGYKKTRRGDTKKPECLYIEEKNNINYINKKEKKTFEKPTIDQLIEYGIKKFVSVEHGTIEDFLDFYEDKGWKVGKTPMKRWDLAFNRWIRAKNAQMPHLYSQTNAKPQPDIKKPLAPHLRPEFGIFIGYIKTGKVKLTEEKHIRRVLEDLLNQGSKIEELQVYLTQHCPEIYQFLA